MSKLLQRFLNYVAIDTRSDDTSESTPTTSCQWNLARLLEKEMKDLGLSEVFLTDKCFVHGMLPANTGGSIPSIGLMAHMDTYPGFDGSSVKPVIHPSYKGGLITLNPQKLLFLDPELFPELNRYIGHDLITTDGTTLLGADDKGGIAEILTAVEHLIAHPDIPHGDIYIAFTPDEETDRGGIDALDLSLFPVDFVITVDGDGQGEVNFENFNAASALVTIRGRSVHTGEAKNKMINSSKIAVEWIGMLPENETPETTEGYEGFFHVDSLSGSVERAEINCMIRDFSPEGFSARKNTLKTITQTLNRKYGDDTVNLTLRDDYINMKNVLEKQPQLISGVLTALKYAGITPQVLPIRGGTDGAMLADRGIAAPNLFIGGHNYHGEFEFVSLQAMEAAVAGIVGIVRHFAGSHSEDFSDEAGA